MKKKILNLTQHEATSEQKEAGVVDLTEQEHAKLRNFLTFNDLPSCKEIEDRADLIAELASEYADPEDRYVMIGGAPFLMSALEDKLKALCFEPLYAFSKRNVIEEVQEDGKIKKTAIFKHIGFVRA